MNGCCSNKAQFNPQNTQFADIVDQLGLDELHDSSQIGHCSKHSTEHMLTEMNNLSPRIQDVTENNFQGLENNTHPLHVSEFSNGDSNHLQMTPSENIAENTMLLDSHYYNVLGYDLSQTYNGGFETLIVGSTIKGCYKDDPKLLENQSEQGQYLHNDVLVSDPTYCDGSVEQYQDHSPSLCTKNMVTDICSENVDQIMLERHGYDKEAKFIALSQQISEEFEFDISNGLSESPPSATINESNFVQTNDPASEVALTLANLRNMETHHELTEAHIDQSQIVIDTNDVSKSNLSLVNGKQKLNRRMRDIPILVDSRNPACDDLKLQKRSRLPPTKKDAQIDAAEVVEDNLLGKLIHATEQCEPESLIPEGVVDDVIPAVGYRIMDMYNLSEMVGMMHNCAAEQRGPVVIQEQVSQREGAVSHISLICTACQEGTVCPTSNRLGGSVGWDINSRVQKLKEEFDIKEEQLQRMLEILGIFYRPSLPQTPLVGTVKSRKITPAAVKKVDPVKKVDQKQEKGKKKASNNKNLVKEKNHECLLCKQKFTYAHHVKVHMKVHDVESHTCPYCKAYFKKKYNLQEHIKKHENVKYECNLCSREYTDRSTLMKHMSSYHEEKFIVECEYCGKKFYHRTHYNEHKRTHTRESPFCCKICGKKFRFQESIKKHMACHALPKFKCNICLKHYRWASTARNHVLTVHDITKEDVDSHISENVNESDQFFDEMLPSQTISSKTADIDDPLSAINLLQEIGEGEKSPSPTLAKQACNNDRSLGFGPKQDFLCDVPINHTTENSPQLFSQSKFAYNC